MGACIGLYERDFYEWAIETACLLRARRFEEVDIDNVAQEIEDMAISQRRELASRLRNLLSHLLKLQHARGRPNLQPSVDGWKEEVSNQRSEIEDLFERMPSLRRFLDSEIPAAYRKARRQVTALGLAPRDVPEACPFSREQLWDTQYFPPSE